MTATTGHATTGAPASSPAASSAAAPGDEPGAVPGATPSVEVVLACTSLPPEVDAGRFVRALVEARLVACGTILPGGRSVYRWQGQVEEATEAVVLLKTRADAVPLLREHLVSHHPYAVPELLITPVVDGLPAYLAWVREEVAPG